MLLASPVARDSISASTITLRLRGFKYALAQDRKTPEAVNQKPSFYIHDESFVLNFTKLRAMM
jgi:hypothetical protein